MTPDDSPKPRVLASALHDYLASPAPQLKNRLKSAIERGDALAVGQLIEAQPLLLQARFAHNDTPLHLAAAGEHPEVVELLIDRGAELTVKNSWAATPLVKALIHGKRKKRVYDAVTLARLA